MMAFYINIKMETLELTNDQSLALKKLAEWEAGSELLFTLKGSAGTGKTFITNRFISKVKSSKAIAVSAPTHKAVKVISKITKRRGVTIQSLCGLRPDLDLNNFNINSPKYKRLAEPTISKFGLIILDEASMLNKDLFKMLKSISQEFKVKILFIGDELQLPPIKEAKSKALTDVSCVELREIVRQSDSNPMGELLLTLRNDIENGTMEFKKYLTDEVAEINANGVGYIALGHVPDFLKMMQNAFKEDNQETKYIAWTNRAVAQGNQQVRKYLFETDAMLSEGDIIMGYKTIKTRDADILKNSEEYVIADIEFSKNKYEFNGYDITLQQLDSGNKSYCFVVSPDSYKSFLQVHQHLLNKALTYRGDAWVKYYGFKNSHILATDIREAIKPNKLIVSKDIDYGYGMTVHKTQGSTYETVFVNGKDIANNKNKTEALKLLYVALSRASKKAVILL